MMHKTKRVKNPRKQRKRLFNSPAHIRHKLMSAPLSKELASSRGVRTMPVRKGDTVRIMRGDNKGFEGKVSRVALKEFRIYMEGLTREKVDGTNIFLPIHPSKVQIRNLNLDDKWRKDILTRKKPTGKPEEEKPKAATAKKAEEAAEKPEKVEEVTEEKPVEAPQIEEAAPEAAKEEAPAEKVEEAPEKAPAPKKAPAKKPAATKKPAKKPAAKEKEVPKEKVTEEKAAPTAKEKAPAKKTAKPKAAAKKAPAKKAAAKPRAKGKASKEAEGGQ